MSLTYFPIRTATSCQLKWNWTALYLNGGFSRTCHRTAETPLTPENFNNFHIYDNNMRIYYSDFGEVKPHKDVTIRDNYNHTLLIYLSDNFDGGKITVKVPIEEIKKHYYVTPEPRKCYGIIFPKDCIHYTDELYTGGKYILLLDCQVDF